MKLFHLCNNPNEVMPLGVLTYIYGFDKPGFFAALRKLDDKIAFTSIAYLGVTVLFYFRVLGEGSKSCLPFIGVRQYRPGRPS